MALLEKLLSERGHESVHFSMQDERNNPSPWSEYFVSNVAYEGGGSVGNSIKAASRMFWSGEVKEKVRRLIADTRPDVAVLNNVYHQLGPSLLAELHRLGVPMIMFARDGKLVCPAYTMLRDGQPCVVHAVGGLKDTVEHMVTGFVFDGEAEKDQAENFVKTSFLLQKRRFRENSCSKS